MVFDVTPTTTFYKNQCLFSCKIRSLSLSFRHFGVRITRNNRLVSSYVLNKRAKFGAKYSRISEIL